MLLHPVSQRSFITHGTHFFFRIRDNNIIIHMYLRYMTFAQARRNANKQKKNIPKCRREKDEREEEGGHGDECVNVTLCS